VRIRRELALRDRASRELIEGLYDLVGEELGERRTRGRVIILELEGQLQIAVQLEVAAGNFGVCSATRVTQVSL
jgi:hypothetical protein